MIRISNIPNYNSSVTLWTNIQYTVKKELLKKVKQIIGNPHMSNKKVGEMTYQYYIDMEDIDDE